LSRVCCVPVDKARETRYKGVTHGDFMRKEMMDGEWGAFLIQKERRVYAVLCHSHYVDR
jgi:hypothetical protein